MRKRRERNWTVEALAAVTGLSTMEITSMECATTHQRSRIFSV